MATGKKERNHILVCDVKGETVCAALTNDKLACLFRMRETDFGAIFAGRVENTVANINAAFVRYRENDTGFLQFDDVPDGALFNRPYTRGDALKAGDLLAVQLNKKAQGTKQARLTGKLSFVSDRAVVRFGKNGVGCSTKLAAELRKTMIQTVKRAVGKDARFPEDFLKTYAVVLRTEAAAAFTKEEDGLERLLDELYASYTRLEELRAHAASRSAGSLLYQADNDKRIAEAVTRLLHFLRQSGKKDEETEIAVVTDDPEMLEHLQKIPVLTAEEGLLPALYDGEIPLVALYGLEKQIEALSQRIVRMKSGSYLVIDETEAMTVIDVNSGQNIRSKNDDFLQVNLDAATEAMRQLRLREITGIVVIDFINMKKESSGEQLEKRLRELSYLDVAHTHFVDFTALGLAELTRSVY